MGNVRHFASNYLLVVSILLLTGASSILFGQIATETPKPLDPAVVDATLYEMKKEAEASNLDYAVYEKLNNYFRETKRFEERTRYFLTLSSVDRANVCAFYFAAQGSPYDDKKELYDRAIHGFDGVRGRRCSAEAAFWAGRDYEEPSKGRTRNQREAYRYFRLALYRDPEIPNVKTYIAKLDPDVVAEGNANDVDDEQERLKKVKVRFDEDVRTILSSNTRYSANMKERASGFGTTPKRSADLLESMKKEMVFQMNVANSALSELSGQFNPVQKEYYERILALAKSRLNSLPLQ